MKRGRQGAEKVTKNHTVYPAGAVYFAGSKRVHLKFVGKTLLTRCGFPLSRE